MKNPTIYRLNGKFVNPEMACDAIVRLDKKPAPPADFLKTLSIMYMAYMNFCLLPMPSERPDKAHPTWTLDTEKEAFISIVSLATDEDLKTIRALLSAALVHGQSQPF